MRQRISKDEQLNDNQPLYEVKEASHQESSVENGASGTDNSDNEFHCPVVAPDSILARDRLIQASDKEEKECITYYIVMQSEDYEGGWLHDEVFLSLPTALEYIEKHEDELAECDYLTLLTVNLNGIHKIWTIHG